MIVTAKIYLNERYTDADVALVTQGLENLSHEPQSIQMEQYEDQNLLWVQFAMRHQSAEDVNVDLQQEVFRHLKNFATVNLRVSK